MKVFQSFSEFTIHNHSELFLFCTGDTLLIHLINSSALNEMVIEK